MPIISGGTLLSVEDAIQRILYKEGALANGDFNNVAEKGQLASDVTNGKLYINTGTKASTTWTVVGLQT
jgi:hypothetical protein